MESETSILQQQPQETQPQQQQKQQQRRPESVSASEAERRASTSHGRPDTRESSKNAQIIQQKQNSEILRSRPSSRDIVPNGNKIQTPHTTPRDPNVVNGAASVEDFLKSMVSENAMPGESDEFDDILDEDELFMALSDEDKEEWSKMIANREQQLMDNKEKHKSWSDSFTRRRMFAYSRMRKLNLNYQDRIKLFSSISTTISQVASGQSSAANTSTKKPVTKRMSEPLMEAENEPLPATRSADKTLKHSQSSGGLTTKIEHISSGATNDTDAKTHADRESSNLNLNGKMDSKGVVCTVEQVT